LTFWTPSINSDHLVDYDNKIVLRGSKTFNQIIDEELDGNPDLSSGLRIALKAQHRARRAGRIPPRIQPLTKTKKWWEFWK